MWNKRSNERGPRYESQVCYLFRHGILTDEELKVLDDEQPLLDCTHEDQENWTFWLSNTPGEAVHEKLRELEREAAEVQGRTSHQGRLSRLVLPRKSMESPDGTL